MGMTSPKLRRHNTLVHRISIIQCTSVLSGFHTQAPPSLIETSFSCRRHKKQRTIFRIFISSEHNQHLDIYTDSLLILRQIQKITVSFFINHIFRYQNLINIRLFCHNYIYKFSIIIRFQTNL